MDEMGLLWLPHKLRRLEANSVAIDIAENIPGGVKMKTAKFKLFISSVALLMPLKSQADNEYYGFIESIPERKVGAWVIGGRQVVVRENTELDEKHGALVVGACAEVEYEWGQVEEIESKEKSRCKKW